MKQLELADAIGVSQQSVPIMEASENVDEDKLSSSGLCAPFVHSYQPFQRNNLLSIKFVNIA